MEREELFGFMSDAANKLAVLSRMSSEGSRSALVGIAVTEDLEIVFDTVKSSRKYADLLADARCSLVVGLTGDTTVQFEGEARELPFDNEYKAVYFAAFADGPSRQAWPGIVYFVVKPRWIRYSDYGDTPPRIEESRFP